MAAANNRLSTAPSHPSHAVRAPARAAKGWLLATPARLVNTPGRARRGGCWRGAARRGPGNDWTRVVFARRAARAPAAARVRGPPYLCASAPRACWAGRGQKWCVARNAGRARRFPELFRRRRVVAAHAARGGFSRRGRAEIEGARRRRRAAALRGRGGEEGGRGGGRARRSAGERGRRSWGPQHREQGALLRGRPGTRERDTTRTAAARAAGAPPPCRACRRSSACFPTSSAR